jgi:hypothetical protein
MITIDPIKLGKTSLVLVVFISLSSFIYFTRYNYIPVQITLGKCDIDYIVSSEQEIRLSPLVSEYFQIKGWEMLMCYGQPSLRGRRMIGEQIPYNKPWRFGANEPTRFYTTANVSMGGIALPKGRYSIYVVPNKYEWEIFINTSTTHWGNDFSTDVLSKNVGSFKVRPKYLINSVEEFVIRTDNSELEDNDKVVFMEWENTQIEFSIVNLEKKDKTEQSLKAATKDYRE